LDSAGDQREECDFGEFNSPYELAITTYEDIYLYACTSDCKLVQKKFTDDATSEYKDYNKWDCVIDLTPVSSPVPVDQTRDVYEMTCTYLCGNRVLDDGEECDIGGWGFDTLVNTGYTGVPATYTAATWYNEQSDPKINTADLALGCTKDCIAYSDGTNTFKFSSTEFS